MSFFGRFFGGGATSHYRAAMRAYEAGKYEAAHAGFQRALASGAAPGDPILHLAAFYAAEAATHLGRLALQEGAPLAALRWLEPALRGPAVSPTLLELTALAYLDSGDPEASSTCLQALLGLDPGRGQAQLLAAAVCRVRGDSAQAQAHLQALRARTSAVVLCDLVRTVLEKQAQQHPELGALLRDFVLSPQSTGV